MPKRSTVAQRAREVQRTTGEKYTKALRRNPTPDERLRLALAAAGLTADAARVETVLQARREAAPLDDLLTALGEQIHEGDDRLPPKLLRAMKGASDAIADHLWGNAGNDPEREPRQVLYAVFGALAYAGSVPDGRALAGAAAAVLGQHDPMVLSDWVRCPSHYKSGEHVHQVGTCEELPALTGPNTPRAQVARMAARALADAARVPFAGDEEWTEAADLISEALTHARLAAAA